MRKNNHIVKIDQFLNITSPKVAYTLGLIWADGCVYSRPERYEKVIKLALISEDMQNIKPILESIGDWNWTKYQPKNKKWKEKTIAYVHNKELHDFLENHNYKSKVDSAFNILNRIPENLRHYWWRGLMDGDGCFSGNRVALWSEYNQNWDFTEQLCGDLNIKGYIYRNKRKGGSESSFVISKLESVKIFINYIYQGNIFGLNRKYQQSRDILNKELVRNKSKYRGISFNRARKKWYIATKNTKKYGFSTEEEAYKYALDNNIEIHVYLRE